MSKTNAAPTVSWVIASQIFKWVALFFIIIAVILSLMVIREIGIVDSRCSDDREFGVFKYHVYLTVVSNKCEPK
jgi:4-hydroxybenzoate polyprenyltransferase